MALTDNLCILHDDCFARATITTATEADPNMPATNLQTPERWKRWRSTSNAIQRIYATIADEDLDNQLWGAWNEIVGDGSNYEVFLEKIWPNAGKNIRPGDNVTLAFETKVDQAAYDAGVSAYLALFWVSTIGILGGQIASNYASLNYTQINLNGVIGNYADDVDGINIGFWHYPSNINTGNVYLRRAKLLKHPPGELALAIVDHNLPPRSVIRVQGWYDASDGNDFTVAVDHEIQADWTDTAPGVIDRGDQPLLDAVGNRTTIIPLGVAEMPKYLKLAFARQGDTFDEFDGYIEASRIMLGRLWRPKTNLSWGAQIAHKRIEDVLTAASGAQWINPYGTARRVPIPLQYLDGQDRDTLIAIYNLSRGQPIIAGLHPTGDAAAATMNALYCRMTDLTRSRRTATTSAAQIILEEIL